MEGLGSFGGAGKVSVVIGACLVVLVLIVDCLVASVKTSTNSALTQTTLASRMSSGELTDSPIPVEIVLNHWSELGYTTCPGFITIQTQVTERKVRLVVPNHKPPFLIGLSSGVSSSVVSQVLNTKQHNHVTEREA